MMQVHDCAVVQQAVHFSRRYTLGEVQERWHALLYDPTASRLACAAVASLDEGERSAAARGLLWSQEEEKLLVGLAQPADGELPTDEDFAALLRREVSGFATCRTVASLRAHYRLLQAAGVCSPAALLAGVPAPPTEQGDRHQAFSEVMESLISRQRPAHATKHGDGRRGSAAPRTPVELDPEVQSELDHIDRKHKRKIRRLEHQLLSWQCSDYSNVDVDKEFTFDKNTLAVLCGRKLRYKMKTKEVVIGRQAPDSVVDVDICVEAPTCRAVSRQQALIKLKHDGFFYMINKGRCPVFVNGMAVKVGSRKRLFNNVLLEFGPVCLLFVINHELLAKIHQQL